MKYLLTILGLALATARSFGASAQANDDFAKASVVAVSSSTISASALANGVTYIITSLGSTDFTAVGADANLVGTVFVATGPATGTGTVSGVATYGGTNLGATSEIGEPVHAGVGAGNSVWWVWTPTAPGTATIDTNGSSFDTVLAVYRKNGTGVATLTPLAYDDDTSASNVTSRVSFTVVQGATYYIAVDGFKGGARGAAGSVVLHLAVGPGTYNAQNDDYANRSVIAGEYAVATGSSELATIQSGENAVVYYSYAVNSVWWTWKAPRSGRVTISAQMDMNQGFGWLNFYGELEVYSNTTDSLAGLELLTADEGSLNTTTSTPSVIRTVAEGDVLLMRVADWASQGGAQITLTVTMDSSDFNNDQFAKRSLLSGAGTSASVSNSLATGQAGEPGHYEEVVAGNFVVGETYMINSLGSTDFTAIGATANVLGTEFIATDVGAGSGTALHLRPMIVQAAVLYKADKLEAGKRYVINTVGTTNFIAIGAPFNFPGVVFTATGPGTGTGTAYLLNTGLLTVGKTYRIETLDPSTDFTLLGATSNTVGLTFTATDTGSCVATVLPVDVIAAGSFVIGRNYRIDSVGTTDFTAIGAASNAVGTSFQATGVGSGTGTASTPTASKSVWWTWVAPANGYVSINTAGTRFDTLLKAYTTAGVNNPTLADLYPVASNDDVDATDTTSLIRFQVVKGTSYQIAVDSGGLYRQAGSITLGLSFTPDTPVITTHPQNQTAFVSGAPAAFTVENTGAVAIYDWQVKTLGSTTWVHFSDGVTTPALIPNGVATSTLTLPSATQVMNGNQYRCIITNSAGQVTSKTAKLTVISQTTFQGAAPVNSDLGVTFPAAPIGATAVTYYASGLPSGLVLNKTTGVISGRITAKPNATYTINYWISYTLGSVKTTTSAQNAVVLINPCPASMIGGFEGLLVNGAPSVPTGKVSLAVGSSGSFTGKLMYNGVVYSLRGALVLDSVTAPTQGSATLSLNQPSTLSLVVTVKTDSTMVAVLKDGLTTVGDTGTDGAQIKTYTMVEPAPWVSDYTMAFTDPTYSIPGSGPQGSGYALGTIAFNGVLKFRGKLADGTPVTGMIPTDNSTNGQYRVYTTLYSNKLGSLAGWLPLSVRGVNTGRYHVATGSGSDLYWAKQAITNDRGSYPAGFGPAALNALMEPWIMPTNSFLIGSMGLLTSDSQTIGNFNLKLAQTAGPDNTGGNLEVLPTSLKMDALSRVTVLNVTNPTGFNVKITSRTGLYKGSFKLSDNRKVPFEGVLLQLLDPTSGDAFGYGYFLVPPALTPPGGTTLSGDVQFSVP